MTARIDFHHHVVPPALRATTHTPMALPDTTQQLATMDGYGIEAACLSVTPRVYLHAPDKAPETARITNEHLADLMRAHPSRFAAFAALPLPDVKATLAEIRHALDELKLDAVGMFSSQRDVYLGDERCDPVMAELNRRGALVFVHPAHAVAPKALNLKAPDGAVEYIFDSSRAIANLLVNRTFKRYPDIRWVFSHAGSAIPYLTARLSVATGIHDVPQQLRGVYFDLASSASGYALPSLCAVADVSHILWGSDLPFIHGENQRHEIEEWEAYTGFSAEERAQIERGNALRLLPRLAGAVSQRTQ